MPFIKYNEVLPHAAVITLNCPETRNLMTPGLIEELDKYLSLINQNPEIKVVVINGAGKSFSMGFDLPGFIDKFHSDNIGSDKEEKLYELIIKLQNIFLKISHSPAVFIASMQRHVFGAGLDLASWCDIRIGAKNSKYCIAETDLGIVADLGSLNNLPYIIGESNTRYLALTGSVLSGESAFAMGLLNQITENENLEKDTMNLVNKLLNKPGNILKSLKSSLNHLMTVPHAQGLEFLAKLNSKELLRSGILKE